MLKIIIIAIIILVVVCVILNKVLDDAWKGMFITCIPIVGGFYIIIKIVSKLFGGKE